MRIRSFAHLGDRELLSALSVCVAQECSATAEVVALIGEVEARRLFAHAGYPSMHAYCVHVLHLSEGGAFKRIQVARAARECPALLDALADGRLHLTGARLLAPRLTRENAEQLLSEATHKTKAEIEEMLARRYPSSEVMPLVMVVPSTPMTKPQSVGTEVSPQVSSDCVQPASRERVPGPVMSSSTVKPIAEKRFMLQLSMDGAMRERLRYAQELLSHRIPSGDLTAVLDLALAVLIRSLEKRKFAAIDKPRQAAGAEAAAATPARRMLN